MKCLIIHLLTIKNIVSHFSPHSSSIFESNENFPGDGNGTSISFLLFSYSKIGVSAFILILSKGLYFGI